jgi:sugar/nucleoside kinase (ribokinase family)
VNGALLSDYCEEIRKSLKERHGEVSVVVMPDFFLDRLISLGWDAHVFSKKLEDVARKKGGSIDGIVQKELRGGNAINTASALAALDIKVTPIVCTDKLGLEIIKFHLNPYSIDLSYVKTSDEVSITTAIEFNAERGKANVMLRSVGSLAGFGPQNLDNADFELIQNADYVCIFNWAGTRRFGTELARTIFAHVREKGRGKTYYDTADPTPNKRGTPDLMKKVLKGRYVDILSVNENEAICYGKQLSEEVGKLKKILPFEESAKEAARILASRLSERIDLHTTSFAASFTKKRETIIPAFKVPVLRATGAGDAWNAGNILGDAWGLSDNCRLMLANAVAAFYISSRNGIHPTRKQLVDFLEKHKLKISSSI